MPVGPSRPAIPSAPERVILNLRPGGAFVVLWASRWLMLSLAIGIAVGAFQSRALGAMLGVLLAAISLMAAAIVALCRRYMLTDRHASVRLGVFSRVAAELPLANVQHVTMTRSLAERILGAGTIAIASAGTDGYAVVWQTVDAPEGVLALVRATTEARAQSSNPPSPAPLSPSPFLILGLVGGIGAGKSAVAAALGDAGFLVVDSDKEAKAALDQPAIRDQLTQWWGPSVIGADGHIDRKRIAEIIFATPADRARLEGLIHPLIKRNRAALASRARQDGKRGVIVDAPLLYEAGVDQECDFVIFVDAPREQRLARVKARGWDDAELDRREKAQLSLQEKRTRADAVIENHGTLDDVRVAVGRLLADLAARLPNPNRQTNAPVST
ncbi:MAG: dephospho-CoA kinase [Phycisphaerales bacterium]|jgi:dephospho-CoA kinase